METIKKTLTQIREIWERSGRGNRVAMIALALVSIAAITGVGIWSAQPQYIPLASGLMPDETAKIVSLMETEGIAYQLNHAGTSISVPKTDWPMARIGLGKELPSAGDEPPIPEEGILDPPSKMHETRLRNKERMLGATIQRMHGIRSAKVHISKEDFEPFLRPSEQTRASVMLDLERGLHFSRENADAIVQLVSHAVEGLAPESVSLTSTKGENLASPGTNVNAEVNQRLEYQKLVESHFAAKAQSMLAPCLGPNKAIVRVTVRLDFQKLTTKTEIFDSENKVAIEEDITSNSTSGDLQGGIAGAAGNLGTQNALVRGGTSKEETNKSKWEVPKTIEELETIPGAIKRLSVGVIVDLSEDAPPIDPNAADADPAAQAPPKKKMTIADVETLIKQVVGIDDERGDQIAVIESAIRDPFAGDAVEATGAWDQYRDMFQVVSLGLASLVAIVFGLLTLRRLKPITLPPDTSETESKRDKLVKEISDEATKHPETISQIVAAWLDEPLPTQDPTATDEAATGDDAGNAEPPADEVRAAA